MIKVILKVFIVLYYTKAHKGIMKFKRLTVSLFQLMVLGTHDS